MASPQSERLPISPRSAQPLSITPNSRVLKSPLSDEAIWKRLKEAGFDEESIKMRDKAALIAYIGKLEAEIYDHQHHMGLLILERKELASKYEQLEASAESSELKHKCDSAKHLSAIAEARKREESLKKVVGVKEECIASLEKALHEMRAECAETKVAADCKLSEARTMIEESQKKFAEAEAKFHAAESLQAEATRYHCVAGRKLQEIEAREDDLRRRMLSFKSESEEKEKDISVERQSLSERQKSLQQEQERLLDAQSLLNQREDHIFSRSQELNRLQKELEETKLNVENERRTLYDKKSDLDLKEGSLQRREEALIKQEAALNKKEQELLVLQEKISSKQSEEIQKVIASHEAALRTRKSGFDAEMELKQRLVEHEIETKRRAWELREVDLRQREDIVQEKEHELEVRLRALEEREKDVAEISSSLEEKDRGLRAAENEYESNKMQLQKEREEINALKMDLGQSLNLLEDKKRQVEYAKERLDALRSETDDLSALELKLKEEIDLVRSQKLEIFAEAEKLKVEKSKFEAEWELMDDKREQLQKEAQRIAEEKLAVSNLIKEEHDSLRREKDAMQQKYVKDVESLSREQIDFKKKMVEEHSEWFSRMQQEHTDFLLDIEMQKRELESLIERRREEVESYLIEREKSLEQEKKNELEYVNSLKEKAAKELEQVSLEMERLHAERREINLEREQRNKEWAELNTCIEELKVQRDKLQKQRELLLADREQIHVQTEELRKLEDLKVVSDNIAMGEMIKSDVEHKQQKKLLRLQTLYNGLDSFKDVNASSNGNGFSAPYMKKLDGNSSSSAHSSWIKRCADRLFRHSPDKSSVKSGENHPVSNSDNAIQRYPLDETSNCNFYERQQLNSLEEPKVIVEVPPYGLNVSGVKEAFNESTALSIPDQELRARRKRASGNSVLNNDVDPLLDENLKSKKMRQEDASGAPLDHSATCCVISVQSEVPEVPQELKSSDQLEEVVEYTSLVITEKTIDVSEVTCEKNYAAIVADQDRSDPLSNPILETTEGVNGHSNSPHTADGVIYA